MSLSVLMAVYFKEQPKYLEESLKSLTKQTLKAAEVVLVEDGPISYNLKSIIDSYRQELNIVSVFLNENSGLAAALNEGLKHCSNDLILRMDTDDIALPNRFEKQLTFMNQNCDIQACSGFIEEFNDSNEDWSLRSLPLKHVELVNFAKKRSPLSHPAVIFRKQAVLSVGGYPEIYPEDYLLWIKLIQKGHKIANISDVLVRMRTGQDFITRRGRHFLKGEIQIYKYMYRTKFINLFEFLFIFLIKTILRLSPNFIKVFLYKMAR